MFLGFNSFLFFPWMNLNIELFLLEFLFFYFFINLISFKSFFKFYFNFFLLTVVLLLFLGYLNVDILINFFFLIELTALFIILIFYIYLNIDFKDYFKKKYNWLIILTFLALNSFYIKIEKPFFSYFFFWVDYYESKNNLLLNDLYSLFISFYYLNSFFFIFLGFLLFFVSILVLIIYTFSKTKIFSTNLKIKKLIATKNYIIAKNILRSQNLKVQKFSSSKLRILKKK